MLHNLYTLLSHQLYGTSIIKKPDSERSTLSDQSIKMPFPLLPIFQAGALVYYMVLQIEHEKSHYAKEEVILFQKKVLSLSLNIIPDKDYPIPPDITNKQHYQNMILSKLQKTALISCWGIFLPFLTDALLKGICPLSFFYLLMSCRNTDQIIDNALLLLNKPMMDLDVKADKGPITHYFIGKKYPIIQDELLLYTDA